MALLQPVHCRLMCFASGFLAELRVEGNCAMARVYEVVTRIWILRPPDLGWRCQVCNTYEHVLWFQDLHWGIRAMKVLP